MKIAILNAHPYPESFCNALVLEYERGAKEGGHEPIRVDLRDLSFDLNLKYGYSHRMELEPDLVEQQRILKECDHLLIVTPFWWGGAPALLKGYFDRILLPHYAFECDSSAVCKGLFAGKSASVVYTQDAPFFWTLFVYRDGFWSVLKYATLKFCGFSPIKRKWFTGVRKSSLGKREAWLKETFALGKKGF